MSAYAFDPSTTRPGGPQEAIQGPLALDDLARLLGGYVWVERRLFGVLGRWVVTEPAPEAALLFDRNSQLHAWHAELFAEQLPTPPPDQAGLVAPPSAGVARLMDALDDDGERAGAGPLDRRVGLGRVVLPRLVAGYTRHLGRTVPVADGALSRALRLVVRDDVEAWIEAESLLQELAGAAGAGPDGPVGTVHRQGVLQELLSAAGPGLAPGPRPGPPPHAGAGCSSPTGVPPLLDAPRTA
ncbi:MAG: hypothetical protein ACYDD6_07680, partial [Acidimicrobiales bacterium]